MIIAKSYCNCCGKQIPGDSGLAICMSSKEKMVILFPIFKPDSGVNAGQRKKEILPDHEGMVNLEFCDKDCMVRFICERNCEDFIDRKEFE